jgi:hypothetical protein
MLPFVTLLFVSLNAFAQSKTPRLFPHPLTAIESNNRLKEIENFDRNYDEKIHMIKAKASKHYHSDLDETYTIHHVLQSFNYCLALLDSHIPSNQARAFDVLRACLELQDKDPSSKTFGVWPYFLEEPFATKKSPPDRNWADFCAVRILRILNNYYSILPADLQIAANQALRNAAKEIQHRDIKPDYTNICLMGLHVCYMTAMMYDDSDMMLYAKKRLADFYSCTLLNNGFVEYNSPAYTKLALDEVLELKQDVTDSNDLALLNAIYFTGWRILAQHYHAPTAQWAGPHGRAYSVLANGGIYNWLYTSSNGIIHPSTQINFSKTEDPYLKHYLPETLLPSFTGAIFPRIQIDTFIRANQNFEINPLVSYQEKDTTRKLEMHDVIGKTYFTHKFALSSVNKSCMWDQRRPVLAYWGDASNPNYMRVRLLHDQVDYAAANVFCNQDSTNILGAINFTTNGGDKHVTIDAIKNATIEATDLRIRFEFGGDFKNVNYTQIDTLNKIAYVQSKGLNFRVEVPIVRFMENSPVFLSGADASSKWVDLVLYSGEKKSINFEQIQEAVIGFLINISEGNFSQSSKVKSSIKKGQLILSSGGLKVNVAVKPYPEKVSLLLK